MDQMVPDLFRENRETGAESLSYSGAAPATVSGVSPSMPLDQLVREGGETHQPQARRPAIVTETPTRAGRPEEDT